MSSATGVPLGQKPVVRGTSSSRRAQGGQLLGTAGKVDSGCQGINKGQAWGQGGGETRSLMLLPVTQTGAGRSPGAGSFLLRGKPAIFYPLHFQKRYAYFKCHWAARLGSFLSSTSGRLHGSLTQLEGGAGQARPGGTRGGQPAQKPHSGGQGEGSGEGSISLDHQLAW